MSSSSRRKIGLRAGDRREICSVRTYRPTPERDNFDRPVERGRGRQSPHSTSRSRSRSVVDGETVELKGWLSGAYRDEDDGVGGGDLHLVSRVRPSLGKFDKVGKSGRKERMLLVGGEEGGEEYSSGGE